MDNQLKEKVKAKARRLNELAKRGIGGEKINAQRMLDDLLRKHKMELSEIDCSVNDRFFDIENDEDKTILMNSILSINPYTKITCEKKFVSASLDDEDYAEVKFKFSYFIKLFRVEKELLTMSFFGKHGEFFVPDEKSKSKFRDAEKEVNSVFDSVMKDADIIEKEALEHYNSQSKLEDFGTQEEDTDIKKINMLNLRRLDRMKSVLLDAEYKKANRSVSQKNETRQ